jgi:GT2 family glycosyltransferase
MFTDLAIILVNWNLKDDTIECIDSLLNSGTAHSQIVVVDNGSTDGSVAVLRDRYNNSVVIIESKENLGYAAGVNIGIEYVLSHNYNWVLLLNNDTIVAENFIDALYSGAQQAVGYAILSPIILYHQNPSVIWSMGERFIGHTLLTMRGFKDHRLNENLPSIVPIDVTNGCAMMVSCEVFKRIGLFDGKLFMYGEEVDFCWRARQANFKFACFTPARIWHKISQSAQKDKPNTRYLRIRNQVIFYRRYSTMLQRPFYAIFTLIRLVKMIIMDATRGTFRLVKPSLLGWIDGWFCDLKKNGK